MGQCIKCGVNLIGTPENPPKDQLCHYCERDALKAENASLRGRIQQAHDMLRPMYHSPIPSLMTIRAVCDILRV